MGLTIKKTAPKQASAKKPATKQVQAPNGTKRATKEIFRGWQANETQGQGTPSTNPPDFCKVRKFCKVTNEFCKLCKFANVAPLQFIFFSRRNSCLAVRPAAVLLSKGRCLYPTGSGIVTTDADCS